MHGKGIDHWMGIIGKYIPGKGNKYVYASSGDVVEVEGLSSKPFWNSWNSDPHTKCTLLHVHGGTWFPFGCKSKFFFICEFV